MNDQPRYHDRPGQNAVSGSVNWSPAKSIWISTMTLLAVIGGVQSVTPGNVMVFLVTTAVTLCFGHSLGMHRLFIHRSYKTYRPLEYLFVWLGTIVGLAGPTGMMKTHDIRDWAQRQSHCHDYFAHRQKWYRDLWWQLHCDVSLHNPPEFVPEPWLQEDSVYVFMEKTWMLQQLPLAIPLLLVGGWEWVVWGVCARVAVSVFGHWLIGYIAHNTGRRDWHVRGAAVQGYNIRFCGLITMGECWHNNHHAFPGSARLGIREGQTDPGWWALVLLQLCGMVWEVRRPEDLTHRTELEHINPEPMGAGHEKHGNKCIRPHYS